MVRLQRILCLVVLLLALAPREGWADTRADARRYFQQGMALIDQGKYVEGVALLKKAYALRPHPSVLFNMGRAYAAAGLVDPAIDSFERYLTSDPPDAASVQVVLKDLKERKKLRNLVDEGMAAIDEGRYQDGIAVLKRAYEIRPHPNLLFNIARAYEDAQDYRRAIAAYERYLKSAPQDADDVNERLRRLRAIVARRGAPPRRPEPPAHAEERPDRSGSGKHPRGEARGGGEERSPTLDDAQLERLAQLIARQLRREGDAIPAPSRASPAPQAGEQEGEERELRSEEEGPGPASPRPSVAVRESQIASMTSASTATGAAPVNIAPKTGEAYEEVVVTASRREQSPLDAPNAVTIITDEEIRLSGARTIPDVLRRVPGMDVMAMSYSDYDVAMRGFNRRIANKILVLVDGRTAYEDFLGAVLWTGFSIDLADIERIEVVRGPGSAIYGAYAYTGIVNIITKRPDQINGSVAKLAGGNGGALSAVYQYGERHGPIGVRASAGYERGDKYEVEFDPHRVDYASSQSNPNLSIEAARADATAEYNVKGTGGRLFAGGGVRTGFQELYGVAQIRNQAINGQFYNLRGGYESDLFSLLSFWNGTRVTSAPQFYRTGESPLGSRVKGDVISVAPVFRPVFSLLGEHSLVLGGEYRHEFIAWDYIDTSHQEDFFAVFAQDSWTISPEFTAIASARLDLHPIIGPLGSPRLAMIYKPSPRQALRASIGTAFRQPTQAETYLLLTAPSPVAGVSVTLVGGQSALKPENIATLDVGYLLQPEFGQFEAVAYVNRVGNLITRSALVPAPIKNAFDRSASSYVAYVSDYYNDPAHYLAFGTELSVRVYPLEGVDLGVNYAFQFITNQDSGVRYTSSPLHKLTFWAELRTRFGIDFGASAHLVSSQRWIEPDYDPTSPTGFAAPPLPIPTSVVVIGRVAYRMLDDRLELAISGTNLTDVGTERHREHPFANRVEGRVLGSVTARF